MSGGAALSLALQESRSLTFEAHDAV
jgi:hypothetical protein